MVSEQDIFLNIKISDLQPHLEHISELGLLANHTMGDRGNHNENTILRRHAMDVCFYKKFLSGLPIEAHLPTHMLHEIAVKTIENLNKQDAMVCPIVQLLRSN